MTLPARAPRSDAAQQRRDDQRKLLCGYIRRLLSEDDREAMASPGYRPADWLSPAERDELPPPRPRTPEEEVEYARLAGPPNSTNPRGEAEVDRNVDWQMAQPLYLRKSIPRLLFALGWRERMVLEIHCGQGMGFEAMAHWRPAFQGRQLEGGKTTLFGLHEKVLGEMAATIWDNDGQPRWADLGLEG